MDYTLKSLEKVLDGQQRYLIRGLRSVLKHAVYRLLGGMIELLDATDIIADSREELQASCAALAEALIGELRDDLAPAIEAVAVGLSVDHAQLLRREQRPTATSMKQQYRTARPYD